MAIQEDNYVMPCVHIDADFKAPLVYSATLSTKISILEMGTNKVIFQYYSLSETDRNCLASVVLTTVGVDMKSFQPVPIPEQFRQKFENLKV